MVGNQLPKKIRRENKVTQQYVPNLGEQPEYDARRDAVHIAVAPLIAACDLAPGTHVGIDDAGYADSSSGREHIGVVDPFLEAIVKQGKRCWVFMYPNTVTSLRHVWEHKSFRVKPITKPAINVREP